MAAQRERVLVAGGLEADAPDADQRLELVGQRHGGADGPLGQRVTGKARAIVFRARQRHLVGLVVMTRVVGAHRALEFGELADHVGQQVRLGQFGATHGGSLVHGHAVGVHRVGNMAGDLLQALHAVQLAADLVVVDHVAELRHARGQRLLAILVEEELGVRQARAHHALVAGDDRLGRLGGQVRHDQEAVAQVAGGVGQREILLVGLHGQDQAFLRHGQEGFLEVAGIDHRPLDQRVHFVQQGVRHDHLVGAGCLEQGGADALAAVGIARHHAALVLQQRGVFRRVRDLDAARRQEAVALRDIAGRQAEHGHRHDLGAEQRDQAVRGAHEVHRGAVRALVAHQLRNRQLAERLVQRGLEAVGQRGPTGGVAVEQRLGLAVGGAFQRLPVDLGHADGLGQRGQFLAERGGGGAVGVQRHGDGQDLLALLAVGGAAAHAGHQCGQAARRGERGHAGAGLEQVARAQAVSQALREGIAQAGERLGRQLFGEQFDQQRIGHGLRHESYPTGMKGARCQQRGARLGSTPDSSHRPFCWRNCSVV
ncbi:hypothetical protein D3C86_1166540 [compost metagenome]